MMPEKYPRCHGCGRIQNPREDAPTHDRQCPFKAMARGLAEVDGKLADIAIEVRE